MQDEFKLKKAKLTQSEIKNILNYCPETGVFTWKISLSNRIKAGDVAGCIQKVSEKRCYQTIRIGGKLYYAHRLVWLYMKGSFPVLFIDHIDGDGTNNKFLNLEEKSQSGNMKNVKLHSSNVSGVCGVHLINKKKKYASEIISEGKKYRLIRTDDFFEAVCARKSAELRLGFHENHGTVR